MTTVIGYSFCLAVLMPAFSTDVFFALLGATTRLHDLLAILRATSRMMITVSSPFKIGLTVLVLMAAFAADSGRTTRGVVLLGASILTLFSVLYGGSLNAAAGLTSTVAMFGAAGAILASINGSARLLTGPAITRRQ